MEGLGRILAERQFENVFVALDFAGVPKTETEVERFGAPGT
jgi:hypothetical protein